MYQMYLDRKVFKVIIKIYGTVMIFDDKWMSRDISWKDVFRHNPSKKSLLWKINCWNNFHRKIYSEIIFLIENKKSSSDKGIASSHFRISLMNCKTSRVSYQETPMHGKTYQTSSSELQTYGKVLILINLSMVVEFLPERRKSMISISIRNWYFCI